MMTPHLTARAARDLVTMAYAEWREDKASRLAAALAYYTAFSVTPLLLIAIAVAGLVFGDEAARGEVFAQLRGLLGDDGAAILEAAVRSASQPGHGVLSIAMSGVMLVWSASNVFVQLQDALNTIWKVQPIPGTGVRATIERRIESVTLVLATGFLLLVSLVISALLSLIGNLFRDALPGDAFVWQAANVVVSFGVVTALFAAIYKVVPDVEIAWRDVWVGAATTALLFTVGKELIGLYLGHAGIGSVYGAAGSLLVLLAWVYYASQILLFGAELTQVYARMYGTRIRPAEEAIRLDKVTRARQGIPHTETVARVARRDACERTRTADESERTPVRTSESASREGRG